MQAGGGKAPQMRYPTILLQGKYDLVPDQHRDLTTVGGVPILGAEDHIQQKKLGGGILKPAQRLEAVGHGSRGSREDGSNVKGSGEVCINIWNRELGGDQVDAQGPDGIPPSGGATNHGYGGETWGRRRVGLSSGRGGDGICRAPPHQSIHKESGDKHSVEGGLPVYL